MKWFRLYDEITRDRKLRRHPSCVRWAWIAVLCTANRSPVRGSLLLSENVPATISDLADEASLSKKEMENAFKIFIDQKMLENLGDTWSVSNWNRRQFESDSSAIRTKRNREKSPSHDRHMTVTVTPPEYRVQSTEYRVQRREEKESTKESVCDLSEKDDKREDGYPEDFEAFWKPYPRHDEKRGAYKNWCTRIKEKVPKESLILAAENYGEHCQDQGTSKKYIKLAATFLGPQKPFEDWIEPQEDPEPDDDEPESSRPNLTYYGGYDK